MFYPCISVSSVSSVVALFAASRHDMHFDATLHRANMLTEATADTTFRVNVGNSIRLLIDRQMSAISASYVAEVATNTEPIVDMAPYLFPLQIVMCNDLGERFAHENCSPCTRHG